jgi:WD40-like Beta Propeller Repeat.
VWEQSADGTGEPRLRSGVDSLERLIAATGSDAKAAALSPDSRWIAYVSNEQGANEVFVRPFPERERRQVASLERRWHGAALGAQRARAVLRRQREDARRADQSGSALFGGTTARPVRDPGRVRAGSLASGTFAITPDDRRFLMVRDNSWGEMAGTPTLVVVQGFFDELRAKLKE